jgi:signal transduction histidine kinase
VLLDVPVYSDVAVPVATWSVARFAPWRPAAVVLGAGLVGAVLAPWDWLGPVGGSTPSGYVAYSLTLAAVVVTPWALGTAGRSRERFVDSLVERGERIEREAEQQVRLAAIEERTRIAREMHDVVAHGLSVIVVQADGARYAAARDPEVAHTTLATIAETGRESLTEMRRLLGLLRADDTGAAPQPGLGDIEALVAEARELGTVHATLPDPDPDAASVPAGVALTAYRVAQEALSNVRRHAGPATTWVTVSVDDAVTVLVEDDGHGAAAASDGRGLGLVGMRERVEVHEGSLDVGPRPGGGFRVRARIPL